jgi:uncharacterized protein YkwD
MGSPTFTVHPRLPRLPWTLALLGCCLVLSCTRAPAVHFGSGLPDVPTTAEIGKMEREMFELLNRDRRAAGLGPLRYDERLAAVARYQSADMRDHRFFAHQSPNTGSPEDRLDAAGYLFLAARENLSEASDVTTSQAGLMKSPHHYENIMANDVSHVGVGIVRGGVADARNLMVTQLFARPGKVEKPGEVERAVARTITQARSEAGLGAMKQNPQLTALADEYAAQIDPAQFDASVATIGQQLPERLGASPISGVGAVLVSGQLVPDSSGFALPEPLLGARAAQMGLALRRVEGPKQRPTWLVLLLVGMKD